MHTLKIIRNIILVLLITAIVVVGAGLGLLWRAQAVIDVAEDETADYTVLIHPSGKYERLGELDDGVRCRLADYMKANDLVFKPGRQAFLATGDVTLETLLLRYFTFDTKQISEVK